MPTEGTKSVARRGRVLTIVGKMIDTLENPNVGAPSNGTVYTKDWYLCHPLNFSIQRLILSSNKPPRSRQITLQIVGRQPTGEVVQLSDVYVIEDIRTGPRSLSIRGNPGDLGALFVRLTLEYDDTVPLELYASLELLGTEVTS